MKINNEIKADMLSKSIKIINDFLALVFTTIMLVNNFEMVVIWNRIDLLLKASMFACVFIAVKIIFVIIGVLFLALCQLYRRKRNNTIEQSMVCDDKKETLNNILKTIIASL